MNILHISADNQHYIVDKYNSVDADMSIYYIDITERWVECAGIDCDNCNYHSTCASNDGYKSLYNTVIDRAFPTFRTEHPEYFL